MATFPTAPHTSFREFERNMTMRHWSSVLVVMVSLAVGCSGPPGKVTKGTVPATREGRMSGTWKGIPKAEDASKSKQGSASPYLSEQLGGYSLVLNPDGSFSADWRGLRKSGTWRIQGEAVILTPDSVMGKSKSDAGDDAHYFEQDNSLKILQDDTQLKLEAKSQDAESVVFSKALS